MAFEAGTGGDASVKKKAKKKSATKRKKATKKGRGR
jgi:hypothetical protein